MATTKLITAEDLFEMGSDSGFELVRGELVEMAPAGHESSAIALRLAIRIGAVVEANQLGSISGADGGYVLSREPDVVVAPDFAFVQESRLPEPEQRRRYLELAPDFVIEVVSPSDRFTNLNDKVMLYLNAGVRLVWVVDPMRETVTVYTAEDSPQVVTTAGTLDCGDVIPGLSLPVAEIFR
jgi:Uma2 family endonuclease